MLLIPRPPKPRSKFCKPATSAFWKENSSGATTRLSPSASPASRSFAAILTCADSRISPELIFDLAPGNLFITRIAGNGVDVGTLGSAEYALAMLGAKLVLVLGHSDCGAVKAALAVTQGVASYPAAKYGSIGEVVGVVLPAVQSVPPGEDALKRGVVANALAQAAALRDRDPIIAPAVQALSAAASRHRLDVTLTTMPPLSAFPKTWNACCIRGLRDLFTDGTLRETQSLHSSGLWAQLTAGGPARPPDRTPPPAPPAMRFDLSDPSPPSRVGSANSLSTNSCQPNAGPHLKSEVGRFLADVASGVWCTGRCDDFVPRPHRSLDSTDLKANAPGDDFPSLLHRG